MEQKRKEGLAEADLVALLASLRVEPTPEADFEERFLYDFHDRVAREMVCCSARRRVWEHVVQLLTNFGRRRLVYGASTLGVGVLAMGGYMVVPDSEEAPSNRRVMVAKRFDNTVSALVPGLARDCRSCTRVRVEPEVAPYDRENVLGSSDTLVGTGNMYTSSMRHEDSVWQISPLETVSDFGGDMVLGF